MKKEHRAILIIAFTILLFIPLTQAGFFDWITGKATLGPTNLSINLGNNAPNITRVGVASSYSPQEGTYTNVTFSFTGYDPDGVGNLNDGTVRANATIFGWNTIVRANSSACSVVGNLDSTSRNYTCNITLWFFDTPAGGARAWNISVSLADINGVWTNNRSRSFVYTDETCIVVGPQTITFTGVTAGSTNRTSTDYNIINNTCNHNSTTLQVNGTNLLGDTNPAYHLNAENFTSSNRTGSNIECDYTQTSYVTSLRHNIYRTVPSASLLRGDYSFNNGTGQEDIYLCLVNVSSGQLSQAYSTGRGGCWYIRVT